MPPRGVKSTKRKRQYKHIKESGKERGMSERRATEMAARTVNKQRRETGQTKGSRKSGRSGSSTSSTRRSSSGRRKSSSPKKK